MYTYENRFFSMEKYLHVLEPRRRRRAVQTLLYHRYYKSNNNTINRHIGDVRSVCSNNSHCSGIFFFLKTALSVGSRGSVYYIIFYIEI